MKDIRLSTLGIKVGYAIETTSGVRPTTGYTHLTMIKEVPSFNVAPNTIDATVLSDSEYVVYVQGLKDLGGALEFNANFTEEFYNLWTGAIEEYKIAKNEGRRMWFSIDIPNYSQAFFYPIEPASYAFGGASVNSVLESPIYVTIIGESVVSTKPTYKEDVLQTVTFTVTNTSDLGVLGVEIDINGVGQVVTNTSGIATVQVLAGEYLFKASKDVKTVYNGFVVENASVNVTITDF